MSHLYPTRIVKMTSVVLRASIVAMSAWIVVANIAMACERENLIRELSFLEPEREPARIEELLAALSSIGRDAYCEGLGSLSAALHASARLDQARSILDRSIQECGIDVQSIIRLSRVVNAGGKTLCGEDWRQVTAEATTTAASLSDSESYALSLASMILWDRCATDGDEPSPNAPSVDSLVEIRAKMAFDSRFDEPVRRYAEQMVRSEFARRTGRYDEAQAHLESALTIVCERQELAKAVVGAAKPEHGLPSWIDMRLDASYLVLQFDQVPHLRVDSSNEDCISSLRSFVATVEREYQEAGQLKP
jgi:hypothetical protein